MSERESDDDKLSVHSEVQGASGSESDISSRKRKRTNGASQHADIKDDEGANDNASDKAVAKEEAEDEDEEELEELQDDLFGDMSADEKARHRDDVNDIIDDESDELTSSRGRSRTPEEPVLKRQAEISLGRYTAIDPDEDGDVYLLRLPPQLPLNSELFSPDTFTIPKPSNFAPSPYALATTAIRFRQHPTKPDEFQSNSRIIQWSDGSLSLQIASSPNLYDLPSKLLAPPPTATDYNPREDSHTYLLLPHEGASMLRVVGHATQALSVLTAGDNIPDEAVARLHEQLTTAIAARGAVASMGTVLVDPEQSRREAEKAERERQRQERRVEAQRRKHEMFNMERGMPSNRPAVSRGLSAMDIEERKKRHGRGVSPGMGQRRGATRQDEYDVDDGFLDDTEEGDGFIVDDEDEDEDMQDEEMEAERRARKLKQKQERNKQKGKKSARPRPRDTDLDEDEEEEAQFTDASERREKRKSSKELSQEKDARDEEEEDEYEIRGFSGGGRKRRRFVVDDEDDE